MKKANVIGEFSRIAKLSEYVPECIPVDNVEGFRQVSDDCVEIHMLLGAFLLDLSDRKYHIDGAAAWSESTLGFWKGLLRHRADYATEDDSCKNRPSD